VNAKKSKKLKERFQAKSIQFSTDLNRENKRDSNILKVSPTTLKSILFQEMMEAIVFN
jgi:hypothetical protein